jgi:hypothetical protein
MVKKHERQKFNKILSNWYSNYKPIYNVSSKHTFIYPPNSTTCYNNNVYWIDNSYLNNNHTPHIHKKYYGACFRCWIDNIDE